MYLYNRSDITRALQLVGELLAAEGHEFSIVILGGAALNLLGVVERTTTDVDIIAFASTKEGVLDESVLTKPPTPLPAPLLRAARTVARDLALEENWLNAGPALQWRNGLPPGLAQRVKWQQRAGLRVGVVDRYDLIFFKLFAAADSAGPRSVHFQDLLALNPSADDLNTAAAWVATQDASPEFASVLRQVVAHVRTDLRLD